MISRIMQRNRTSQRQMVGFGMIDVAKPTSF
jgi:hypothetical protein